jgi:hypothetical protein
MEGKGSRLWTAHGVSRDTEPTGSDKMPGCALEVHWIWLIPDQKKRELPDQKLKERFSIFIELARWRW